MVTGITVAARANAAAAKRQNAYVMNDNHSYMNSESTETFPSAMDMVISRYYHADDHRQAR
jgi:hypothetical protein